MERKRIPAPPGMCKQDEEIYRCLVSAAEAEQKTSKVPCTYLGLQLKDDRFEPDPSNWPAERLHHGKTHANVWFEWKYVFRQPEPHRVCCNVNDIKHHGRAVPLNPLRPCPSLTFTVEWMQAVADHVQAGIKYHGIVYESDRPEIIHELPNGGVDVQREPVHWILPDGRSVVWTVAELAQKKADELVDPDAREAYFAMGDVRITLLTFCVNRHICRLCVVLRS